MQKYPKIQSLFKRDGRGRFIAGDWSRPELEFLAGNRWDWTEKVDGTNIRLCVEDGRLRVGGRTDNAQIPAYLLDAIHATIDPAAIPEGATLYGEGYGPKIQKGGKYRDDHAFVLFDVLIGGWWLERDNVRQVAQQVGVEVVPSVGTGTLYEAIDTVCGMRSQWGDFEAEGIVARPVVPLLMRDGSPILTKVKAKDIRAMEQE